MIDVEFYPGMRIDDVTSNRIVDAIAVDMNCFKLFVRGSNAFELDQILGSVLKQADFDSPYGDINKMGTFSSREILFLARDLIVANIYTQYTLGAPNCVSVHWDSVYEGLCGFISSQMESGQTLAVPYMGVNQGNGDPVEFERVIDSIKNDEDLPDINIIVFGSDK